MTTHRIYKANTRTPLRYMIEDDYSQPADLTGLTAKVFGEDSSNASWIAEAVTGVTVHPTTAFTVDASANKIKANSHRVKEGRQIEVATTTTLPGGLEASTRYFARDVEPNAFKVSSSPDGAVVDITSAGSGTHTFKMIGEIEYDFQAADVDTVGRYKLWFNIYTGAEYDTFPRTREGIVIEIEEAL